MLPLGERAEWFLGGDHVRHLLFVADEQAQGSLDYSTQPYPRAWHTVITTMWSASGGHDDAAGLRSLVDLMSTAAWCLPALLSLATASLTVAAARRHGASGRQAQVTGLGAGAVILLAPFLGVYQALGFENSYVGAIVLAVVAREVLTLDEGRRLNAILVTVAGAVVCAHSWQLLLPGCGLALFYVAWPVLRRGTPGARSRCAGVCLVGAAAALPALMAVFTVIGIQHATDSGVEAPVPVPLLVVGVACALGMAVRRRHDPAFLTLLGMVLLPGLTAIYVAVRVGIPLSDYYPSKLMWHSAALGLTPLALTIVRAWAWAGKRRSSLPITAGRRVAGLVGGLLLTCAAVSPAAAFAGAWSTVRGPLVLDAVTSPGAEKAQIVWLGAVGDDTIGRVLLDFYHVRVTQVRTPQSPLDVGEDCALLAAAREPAVLSDRSAAEVRRRYACVPRVQVIPAAQQR